MENHYEKKAGGVEPDPVHLIRNPEETLEARERLGERPLIRHYEKDGKHVVLLGIPHSLRLDDMTKYKNMLREKYPDIFLSGLDIVMLEGSPNIEVESPSEEVIRGYGEQAYLAAVAKEQGVKTHYWDLSTEEKIEACLDNGHSVDATFGWLLGAAGKILLENGRKLDETSLRDIFSRYITPDFVRRIKDVSGYDIDPQHLDLEGLCKKYCRRSLAEATLEDVARISDPYEAGETNTVIQDLNRIRDEHAVSQLKQLQKERNSIFMCAGLDHVVAWEPAVEALYS